MKIKQYDILHHSGDLNELLAEITEDTEIVITRGNTPIARLLPTDIDVLIHTLSKEALALLLKTGNDNASPSTLIRRPNLHPEAFAIGDDFDEPLPDSFWLGEA